MLILIVQGSTYSFISFTLAIDENWKLGPLGSCLVMDTLEDKSLLADSVYWDYGIKVNDHMLKANLDLNIISGMDFLAVNCA